MKIVTVNINDINPILTQIGNFRITGCIIACVAVNGKAELYRCVVKSELKSVIQHMIDSLGP